MLKRELQVTRKSLIIWTSILMMTYLLVYIIYPYIMNSENVVMLEEMMKTFPSELLKTFNMDIASINTVFGWFKTEGYTILVLISGIYSGLLASNIITKEENDKTIEYLYAKPITRKKIVSNKVICSIINILIMIIFLTIFNFIGMYLSNDLNIKQLLMLSLAPLLSSLSLFFICLFISTFFHKTKTTNSITLIIIFISYLLQVIGLMSDKIAFFKYLSIFELASSRQIILNNSISYLSIIITILIITISYILTLKNYQKKELI